MDPISHPFDTVPPSQFIGMEASIIIPKSKVRARRWPKKILFQGEEEVNWNHNSHVTPTSSISPKPKTLDLLNLSNYQKVHSFVKTLFKETRETFFLKQES